MTHSTIYDLDCDTITDGVQSQNICDATINTARRIAKDKGETVVVEDRGTEECYCVTPSGEIEDKPEHWVPAWQNS